MEKLKAKLPADKQAGFDFSFTVNSSFAINYEGDKIFDTIATNLINGKAFDPKSRPADIDAIIKKYKADLDEEFKTTKAAK